MHYKFIVFDTPYYVILTPYISHIIDLLHKPKMFILAFHTLIIFFIEVIIFFSLKLLNYLFE